MDERLVIYYDADPGNPEAAPGKGYFGADIAFVGIAPSPNRPHDRRNEPFGASSYRLLGKILSMAGNRTVYVTNLVKTPVKPGTDPDPALLRYYYPRLLTEIAEMEVKGRILALGTPVAKVLCPGFKSLREDHGTLFWNPQLNLYVVPTYHFSAVGRDHALASELFRDVQRCFNIPDPEEEPFIWVEPPELPPIPEGSDIVLDIETTGLELGDTITAIGIGFLRSKDTIQIHNPSPQYVRDLVTFFKDIDVTIVGHNLAFDISRLCAYGRVGYLKPVIDTMLMSHTQGETKLSLKHLTTKYTDRPGSRAFGGIQDSGYLTEDVQSTKQLYSVLRKKWGAKPPFVHTLLAELVPFIAAMHVRGVYVDRGDIHTIRGDYHERVEKVLEELDTFSPGKHINWNSPAQAVPVLLDAGVPLKDKTPTGAFSLSEPILLPFRGGHPIVDAILRMRDGLKAISFLKYYEGHTTDLHPYLHPTLKLHGTETGRLSCSDPNLQQVTRVGPIKTIFKNRWHRDFEGTDTYLGLVDLSQAELRVAAMLSNDQGLAHALTTEDVHRYIASKVFRKPMEDITAGERKKAKGVAFGLLYGGSPGGLAVKVGASPTEIKYILETFFDTFPNLNKWLEQTGTAGIRTGYVSTLTGRQRSLEQLLADEGENSARRKAVNTPIQGMASDIMLCILRWFCKALVSQRLRTRPLFTVHDSTIMEIYPGEEDIIPDVLAHAFVYALEQSPLANLPLFTSLPILGELKIGRSWAECESTNENYNPWKEWELSSLSGLDIPFIPADQELPKF